MELMSSLSTPTSATSMRGSRCVLRVGRLRLGLGCHAVMAGASHWPSRSVGGEAALDCEGSWSPWGFVVYTGYNQFISCAELASLLAATMAPHCSSLVVPMRSVCIVMDLPASTCTVKCFSCCLCIGGKYLLIKNYRCMLHAGMHTCAVMCVTHACAHTCALMLTHTHTRTHTHTHTRTHTHTHTHTCAHTQTQSKTLGFQPDILCPLVVLGA